MNERTVMADDQAKCSHTPGPWTAEAVVGDDMHDICGPSSPGQGCPNLLASVAYDADDPLPHLSLAEANANARLIAAAPELLFALRACADRMAIAAARREQLAINEPALLLAVDAIAKAEGRSCA